MKFLLIPAKWGFILIIFALLLAIAFPFVLAFLVFCVTKKEDPSEHVQVWRHINQPKKDKQK